jgi:hypothetical protein
LEPPPGKLSGGCYHHSASTTVVVNHALHFFPFPVKRKKLDNPPVMQNKDNPERKKGTVQY